MHRFRRRRDVGGIACRVRFESTRLRLTTLHGQDVGPPLDRLASGPVILAGVRTGDDKVLGRQRADEPEHDKDRDRRDCGEAMPHNDDASIAFRRSPLVPVTAEPGEDSGLQFCL